MNAAPPRHRLENLSFDNRFARLPAAHYTALHPAGLPQPRLIAASSNVPAASR